MVIEAVREDKVSITCRRFIHVKKKKKPKKQVPRSPSSYRDEVQVQEEESYNFSKVGEAGSTSPPPPMIAIAWNCCGIGQPLTI